MSVTVAIPTYNGSVTIERTLRSILDQTYDDFEIVISDDGSTDDTLDVVRRFDDDRIRILEDTARVGPAANWNRALAAGGRPFVKVMAQDDLLYRDNLHTAVSSLSDAADAAFCAVQRDIIGADDAVLIAGRGLAGLDGVVDAGTARRVIVRSGANQFGEGACVVMRRSSAERSGGFDGSLPYVIDVDLWVRLLEWGPMVAVKRSLAAFRVSGSSWSNSLAREQGRQYARFIDVVANSSEGTVSETDVRLGKARARLNGLARQAFYLRHRKRLESANA